MPQNSDAPDLEGGPAAFEVAVAGTLGHEHASGGQLIEVGLDGGSMTSRRFDCRRMLRSCGAAVVSTRGAAGANSVTQGTYVHIAYEAQR